MYTNHKNNYHFWFAFFLAVMDNLPSSQIILLLIKIMFSAILKLPSSHAKKIGEKNR